MPEASRREQARAAIKKGRRKARESAERVRAGKERAQSALQEGRERFEGAKKGAREAHEQWTGTEAREKVMEEARSALSGGGEPDQGQGAGDAQPGGGPRGLPDQQRRVGPGTGQQPPGQPGQRPGQPMDPGQRPRGEVPPDQSPPDAGTMTIEQFERTMVGGMGSRDDPMATGDEDGRPPTPEEFEQEFFGGPDDAISNFERDFLRKL